MLVSGFNTDYLLFYPHQSPGKKTVDVWVMKPDGQTKLGEIKWYGPWRQYCFFPEKETVFNKTCMETIIEVCAYLNNIQRQKRSSE